MGSIRVIGIEKGLKNPGKSTKEDTMMGWKLLLEASLSANSDVFWKLINEATRSRGKFTCQN